jgi:hypothetical protein
MGLPAPNMLHVLDMQPELRRLKAGLYRQVFSYPPHRTLTLSKNQPFHESRFIASPAEDFSELCSYQNIDGDPLLTLICSI